MQAEQSSIDVAENWQKTDIVAMLNNYLRERKRQMPVGGSALHGQFDLM